MLRLLPQVLKEPLRPVLMVIVALLCLDFITNNGGFTTSARMVVNAQDFGCNGMLKPLCRFSGYNTGLPQIR